MKWKKLANPKNIGGCRLKDLNLFGCSLASKSLWRFLFDIVPWGLAIRYKYLQSLIVEKWCRKERKNKARISNIWRHILEDFSILENWLARRIGDGKDTILGIDPWIGGICYFFLS